MPDLTSLQLVSGTVWPRGSTLIFSSYVGSDPAFTVHPQKNIRKIKHPKKIFEILATPKNIPILYLDLKKDPKMHRTDPKTSPILWRSPPPKKKYSQNLHTPKSIHLFENPQKILKFRIWTPKNSLSLRICENIGVPPPPPRPLGCVVAVERLPALHYSIDIIFLSFGIMGFHCGTLKLIEGHWWDLNGRH